MRWKKRRFGVDLKRGSIIRGGGLVWCWAWGKRMDGLWDKDGLGIGFINIKGSVWFMELHKDQLCNLGKVEELTL